MNFLTSIFDTTGFPPRWNCGEWSSAHGWLHILSDLGVWSAYFAIPLTLSYFVLRRRDLPFRGIFVLFVAFILLCGTTHLMEAIIFWWPAYRLAGLIKLLTAIVSWGTLFALVRVVPNVLAMRSPEELEREIAARKAAEDALHRANAELEQRVEARTRELSRANAALHEERGLLQTTLTSIGDGVIVADPEGRVTFLNAVAEALTRWTTAQAKGNRLEHIFRIVNEDSRQPVENPAVRALRHGAIVGLANHTILLARDGTELPIDDSAAPIRDETGRIAGAVLVFRDITERRRLEKENASRLVAARFLASIVESSEDAILSKSLDGVIQTWNAAAEHVFGYTAAEAVGRHDSLTTPPERGQEDQQILARLQAGERLSHFDTVRRRKDGENIPVSLTISPIKDDAGQIIGLSQIARDISERKRAEEELRLLAARLSDADRRKDEFLAMLAHELRNPLAPIRNAVQILKTKGNPDPELMWSRDVIERQVGQMARLLDDLLDVSRITRGKLQLRKQRVPLSLVVDSAVETSRPILDAFNHHFHVALPDTPVFLDVDPVRLAQVLANLLNNAAKYTDPGGHVRLTAKVAEGEVVLSVQDDGIGIPGDMLSRIFEIFAQAKPALERSQGGLGIGLSLVKGLVEMHGGSVEAHSDGLGKGSEFRVSLPLSTAPEVRTPTPAESNGPAQVRRRIVVADDNCDAADSLALMLRLMGHEVRTVHDGQEAVSLAETFRPDVVLLDIGMPRLNGYEAARRIRERPWGKDILLVALTGWGQDEDKRRAEKAGFNNHFTKPVDPDQLAGVLAGFQPSASGKL